MAGGHGDGAAVIGVDGIQNRHSGNFLAADAGIHRLEEAHGGQALAEFFRMVGIASENHSRYTGIRAGGNDLAHIFMPPPAWSEVRWKGEQSTTSVLLFTRPSSKATISEIGFITEPGS